MTNNDELALKLKNLAQSAGADEWQAKKISGDFYVIRKGSYQAVSGYRTYQPIAEIDHKPTRDYVAYASPAAILALLAERDADKKRIGDMQAIVDAAEKLVRCKGRYHSEQNYRALAALFGVTTPDLPPLEHENVHYADAAELEIAALRQRIAELESEASCKFMPVGVMSQSKFEGLDNGDVRFIALWPRPCVPVRRKRPDDGVLVYAKVAGINLEVGE